MTADGWSAADSDDVLAYLARHVGLCVAPALRGRVEAGIRRVAARGGAGSAAALLARLPGAPELLDALVTEATVGETYFFRDPGQLDLVRRRVLPPLVAAGRPVRAWSAGCASGEEAYSLAILLREAGAAEGSSVLGTDVSRERLARARAGRYGPWSLRGVPEAVTARWFRPAGAELRVADEARRLAEFRVLNLLADDDPSAAARTWRMDLVLCRNVLIYLDPASVARVARRLIASLAPDGWLILGASDPPVGELVPCRVVVTEAGIAYRPPSVEDVAACRPSPTCVTVGPRAAPVPDAAPAPAVPAPPAGDVASTRSGGDAGNVASTRSGRDAGEVASMESGGDARDLHDGGGAGDGFEAEVARVRAMADRGELAGAGEACAAALERHRDCPELLALHALLLAEGGRLAEAAEAAGRALYLDRWYVMGHLCLARALARAGDHRGARRALRNAERLLAAADPAAAVPGSGGEPAGRLLHLARAQLHLLEGAAR